jgi:superfamily II DNA or RNA helicase
MEQAHKYSRGVGYFSSGWLREASDGIVALVHNGGTGRIVTSPILQPEDWSAFHKGDEAKQNSILRASLQVAIEDLADSLEHDTRNTLAWLIADGLLEFRFAIARPRWAGGDYHDKVWVFRDTKDDRVALHGSFNDSVKGTLNGEAISVFKSWVPGQDAYVGLHERRLEDLWSGANAQFVVRTIPEASRQELIRLRTTPDRPYAVPGTAKQGQASAPVPHVAVDLRPFQKAAIDAWVAQGRKGILEMATGTGKTYTALAAAAQEYQRSGRLALVVLVPYLHLLEQWRKHCEAFGFSPILCGTGHADWRLDVPSAVSDFRIGLSSAICILAVHKTASGQDFSKAVKSLSAESTLVIGDEVHGLGATGFQSAMLPMAGMHLGLSATPRRWFDEAGTAAIGECFGGVCFEFTLAEAMEQGYLAQYEYHPVLVALTDDELEQYQELTTAIVRLHEAAKKDSRLDRALKKALIDRAQVVWAAREKLPCLVSEIRKLMESANERGERLHHVLVYCAPGEHKRVLRELASLGLRCHEFVYTVSSAERETVLGQFEAGAIEVLVAVRCLDEGVDVPATQTAFFLASTMNPRQFVQRRGRVLRLSVGKSEAVIYDFLVVPPRDVTDISRDTSLSLLRREMPRFAEFSSAAKNTFAARKVVFDLLDSYQALNMLDETPWELYEQALAGESEIGGADDPIVRGDLNG